MLTMSLCFLLDLFPIFWEVTGIKLNFIFCPLGVAAMEIRHVLTCYSYGFNCIKLLSDFDQPITSLGQVSAWQSATLLPISCKFG